MAVRIGHASISEKGTINGAKGDSTKNEVCIRSWYNISAAFMAVHPDAEVREKHAVAVEAACANDKIGYGQSDRNSAYNEAKKVGFNISKITVPCNCDCSSLQNLAALISGAAKVTYGSNGWVTSNMKTKLKAAGYIIIEDLTYLTSATYAVRGAIYVKPGSHTVCALDNGSKYKQTLEKAGLVDTTAAVKPSASTSYYPKYTGTSGRIDEVLKDIGVSASYRGTYKKRTPIAKANGITNYAGTYEQNTKLITLAKQGKLKKISATTEYYPKYAGSSVKVDEVLKTIGVPATYLGSYKKRTPIATANGINGYTGTGTQNNKLITLAKQGKLKKIN